jgi:hypothetical protein
MTCTACGRTATRIRRERCDACYMRLYRHGELPAGAACVGCGERRRSVLVPARLGVLCGNCSVLARARPAIRNVGELKRRAARERRAGVERRALARGGRRRTDRLASFDPALD